MGGKILIVSILACLAAACSSSSAVSETKNAATGGNSSNAKAGSVQTSATPAGEPVSITAFSLPDALASEPEQYENRVLIVEYADLSEVSYDQLKIDNGAVTPPIICKGDFSGAMWDKIKTNVARIKSQRDSGNNKEGFPKIVIKGVYESGGGVHSGSEVVLKDCSFVRVDKS